ncbi:MAG: hypothetical protein ACRDAM_05380 [Casimicrobium sp.]
MPQTPDMHTIRRENLHTLIREFAQARIASGEPSNGAERAFAEQLQMSKSLLSHLKSSRPISDAIALQIERRCKKPAGWLSAVHGTVEVRPAPGEEAFIAQVRTAYRSLDRDGRARLRIAFAALVTQTKL